MLFGIILIVLGTVLVLKVLFKLDIPVLRLLIAGLFIYFGIKVLIGTHGDEKNTAVFSEAKTQYSENDKEHNIIFGKGEVQYSGLPTDKKMNSEVNIVFGSGKLVLPNTPYRVTLHSAFAGAILPDGNIISFGKYNFQSKDFDPEKGHIHITANVVFGSLKFEASNPDKK